MRENNEYKKCQELEMVEHVFLNCDTYTEKNWEELRDLLQHCKSKPGIIITSTNHKIKKFTLMMFPSPSKQRMKKPGKLYKKLNNSSTNPG